MSLSTLKFDKICFESIRGNIIPGLIDSLNKAKHSLSDNPEDYEKDMAIQIEKLCKDLIYIAQAFTGLENFEESASGLFKILLKPQHSLLAAPTQTPIHESKAKKFLEDKLRVHSKVIMKLKLLIPSPEKLLFNKDNPLVLADIGKEPDSLPDLHFSKVFNDSPALKEFRVVYNSLSVITKLCLLCFAAIPANEAIKKRVLVHWWVGEGFVNPPDDGENTVETVEEIADGIFQELTKKGCIEPVYKKRRSVVHSFKMHHLIRSAVIVIAKEVRFFNFDNKGSPTANFSSHSYRACLVYRLKGSRHLMEKMANKPHDLDQNRANIPHDLDQNVANKPHDLDQNVANILDPKMLQTVFNVNESYPDFSNVDWSKLRNLKVLHLGRWHSRAKHHIEVDDIEFLRGLIHLTHLRILSLQGISRIMVLPDSVCKLLSLRILDLGACPNLELLPETIGSLKNLTHLDMSECYLLERMPKGIAFLSELQVLKGFVVGVRDKNDTSCTFHDLFSLKKLRKLSIHTSRADFPVEDELIVLQQFERLRKLTIEWGRLSPPATTQDKGQPAFRGALRSTATLAPRSTATLVPRSTATLNQELNLEKLDLQCYPQKTAPSWLRPGNLKNLKKLYIRGGQLRNLGEVQENDKWAVQTLRLKFLSELEMDWKEIPVSFPDLIYLEKFRCPRLTFFPCDESGEWLKPEMEQWNQSYGKSWYDAFTVAEQRDIVSTLRNSCSGQEEKNERLVSEVSQYKDAVDRVMQERSEAQKSLDGEKKKVEDLMLTVSDREKTIKETEKELGKLRSERDNVSEKNKVMESRLESLVKEKDVMQKNLVEALKKIHDWEAKFESEGAKLKRALTMLKNTAALVSSKSEGKEEVVANDHKLGKEIQPYVVELDAIQNAFRNKEKMVGDLKQQVESLHKVAEAQKKKSFWTLVSSATTIIAAASVAYVAKGR